MIDSLQVIGRSFFCEEPVRVFGTAEQPLFMAVEICNILGLARSPANALKEHPENEKLRYVVRTSGQAREAWFVTEPGMYRLIFKSRKPEAEKFKTWVFNEVLPSIRKYGAYPKPPTPEDIAQLVPPHLIEWCPDDAEFRALPRRRQRTIADRRCLVAQVETAKHQGITVACKGGGGIGPSFFARVGLVEHLSLPPQFHPRRWRLAGLEHAPRAGGSAEPQDSNPTNPNPGHAITLEQTICDQCAKAHPKRPFGDKLAGLHFWDGKKTVFLDFCDRACLAGWLESNPLTPPAPAKTEVVG